MPENSLLLQLLRQSNPAQAMLRTRTGDRGLADQVRFPFLALLGQVERAGMAWIRRVLIPLGLALAILGWYAPWVSTTHQLAALTYNALDLAELCKFIIRAGIATITREWFLVPLPAAALALALWVNRADALPRLMQVAFTLLAAVFSLVPLPPYPFVLKAYASAEDRISFWLSLASVLGVILAFAFARFIAGRWRAGAFIGLALIGAFPAALELVTRALPAMSKVYGSPAVLAWGFGVMLTGFACIVVGAVWREWHA